VNAPDRLNRQNFADSVRAVSSSQIQQEPIENADDDTQGGSARIERCADDVLMRWRGGSRRCRAFLRTYFAIESGDRHLPNDVVDLALVASVDDAPFSLEREHCRRR
jgi:hypothetical protein